jgi:hypothetical protein
MRAGAGLFLFLALLPLPAAQEAAFQRFIHFRDGSVLRLPIREENWQITLIGANGDVADKSVPLSSLQHLTLTAENNFAEKRALLAAVRKLGSRDFRAREQAQAEILALGQTIRPDLETCLGLARETETRSRLNLILSKWPKTIGQESARVPFDLLGFEKEIWGHVGETGIPVVLQGKTYRLKRADVAGMSIAGPKNFGLMVPVSPALSGFRRLQPSDFPPGCIEESFEKTPEGRPLTVGENIEKLFISKGFVLSTSISTSHVSVNGFRVLGKSGGMSVATHQPVWEGEITVRFVQPGRADIPAGVTHFGCYIAAVVPKGTAMVAYDHDGRELGRILTTMNGHEFLGVASATPIHRIRFIPDPKLDKDYTLDDFIYTAPQSPEARHPEKVTVYLREGDRFHCGDVSLDGDKVLCHRMPAGLPDATFSRGAVLRINAPDQGKPLPTLPPGVFAELKDGSVIFGALVKGKDMPVFVHRPDILKKKEQLAGLWGGLFPRLVEAPKNGKTILWNDQQKKWQDVTNVQFAKQIVLVDETMSRLTISYDKAPPLWIAPPSPNPAPGWHVRTKNGDDLVLADGPFTGRLSREVKATWQGQPLRLRATEVRSIYKVGKKP